MLLTASHKEAQFLISDNDIFLAHDIKAKMKEFTVHFHTNS